jgi:hypothetical protein
MIRLPRSAAALALAVIMITLPHLAQTKKAGAPNGNTGSPADGVTCAKTNCHPGPATFLSGIITSDVPAGGYEAGNVYTITATVTDATKTRFGFQISPQDVLGNLLGTMSLINTSETKLTGSGKWITHTTAGTLNPGGKTWTFNWTAPAAGTGDVTFYGAFNFANNDGLKTGDIIKTSSLTIQEFDPNAGVQEANTNASTKLIPNPGNGLFSVILPENTKEAVHIVLYDLSGSEISELYHGYTAEQFVMLDIRHLGLTGGYYLIRTETGNRIMVNKLFLAD